MTPIEPLVPPSASANAPGGMGGVLKREPADFIVEEIPLYEPSGEGEHLYVWVEKSGLAAEDLTAHFARSLRIGRENIGVAGLKDRAAITRQYLSVPAECARHLSAVETPAVRILHTKRHRHKLRTGHLRGNRFEILVRDVVPGALPRAEAVAAVMRAEGFPNFFGPQRFGHGGDTARLGFDLLAGRKTPHDIEPRRRKFLLRLALSAAQARMFNEVLAERRRDALLQTVLAGDVMQVVASGGCFTVEHAEQDQSRFAAREIVLTGPLFGPKMKPPALVPAERERRVLDRYEIRADRAHEFRKLSCGARRPLLIWPGELTIAEEPAGLRFHFSLPSGVYATTLLAEFMGSAAGPEVANLPADGIDDAAGEEHPE